jgi:hypothetical protein
VAILQQFHLLRRACESGSNIRSTSTVKDAPNTGGVFIPVFNKKHKRAPNRVMLIETRHFSLNLLSVILLGLAHSSFVHSLESDDLNWQRLQTTKFKSNPTLPQTAGPIGLTTVKATRGFKGTLTNLMNACLQRRLMEAIPTRARSTIRGARPTQGMPTMTGQAHFTLDSGNL